MCEAAVIHKFELAGLGKAPFRFIGMEEKVYVACHGAPVQPGSSCDYCSNAIRYCYWIESADGKRFKVGSDCIAKIYSDKNRKANISVEDARLLMRVKAAKRDLENKKKWERTSAAYKVLTENPAVRARFASLPHPYGREGSTYLDYAEWCMKYAGTAGKTKIAMMVEKAVKAIETAAV